MANTIGIENLSLKTLAAQLGVKSPSLYNHIDGLDDLKQQLMLYGWKELENKIIEAGHLLLNGAYLALVAVAVYPIATIRKWKKKKQTTRLILFDITRHGILPLLLLCLPYMVGIPLWVVWYFVKDLFLVLLVNSSLLLVMGLYKILFAVFKT
jgi:AcrR family transcriptional regulator